MTRLQVMEAMMKSTKSAMDGLQDKINEMNKKLDLIMELYAEFLDAVEKEEQKNELVREKIEIDEFFGEDGEEE